MRIEHIAFQVELPQLVAKWYADNLGMTIKRASDQGPQMHFLACDDDHVMFEFYNNPAAPLPNYASMHPLLLHIAWISQEPSKDRARLLAAGASSFEDVVTTPAGDQLAMLRDPWGLALQLVKRAKPML